MKTKVLFLIVISFIITSCAAHEVVYVDRRYAIYTRSYVYSTSSTSYVCSGSGKDRKCSFKTTTTYHTRCRLSAESETIPARPPEMTCEYNGRDDIENYVTYNIDWHNQKGKGTYQFRENLWNDLTPGQNHAIISFFYQVTDMDVEQ